MSHMLRTKKGSGRVNTKAEEKTWNQNIESRDGKETQEKENCTRNKAKNNEKKLTGK